MSEGLLSKGVRWVLENRLVVGLALVVGLIASLRAAPFDWDVGGLPRDPVPVDAIPDLGENQQIVFTEWPGRSPQDVEDQVTYPLTVALLGVPGVRTVRSSSMFGFSSIYVVFEEDVEFYWSRSRVLEKLASLPAGTVPEGVQPTLGPDATPLGQVYWYTLEGRDPDGRATGGWGLDELRSIQDWTVRFALASAEGVAEVASVGGFVQEYQIDVDPDALRQHGVTLRDVFQAVRESNLDVGARTVEINRVEYVVRGLGFLDGVEDLEETVVRVADNVPIRVRDVARVGLGPALRRGALDKEGVEAVGGVVVARYGANPLLAIQNVKARLAELAPGLPEKVLVDSGVPRAEVERFAREHGFEAYDGPRLDQAVWLEHLRGTDRALWPEWATLSKVTVVPFYDRSGLIGETLDTLGDALYLQILVTALVVALMVWHLRSSVLIGLLVPVAVGLSFVAMRLFGIEANVVALSGIAIAIGTMVDVGIVVCENTLRHLDEAGPDERRIDVVHRAVSEVAGAVLTAVTTTVVGFLPVFVMTGSEGKLFKPLAWTKTFALVASIVLALTVLPVACHLLLRRPSRRAWVRIGGRLLNLAVAVAVLAFLASAWSPLGPEAGEGRNLLLVAVVVVGLLGGFWLFQLCYGPLLRAFLRHKLAFLAVPATIVAAGLAAWLGFGRAYGFVPAAAERLGLAPERVTATRGWSALDQAFPGLGREFMPPLDEGSFLYMPSTLAHASIGESMDALQRQDRAIAAVPEVELVVGKIGRAESPLDPAPIGMVEAVVNLRPEYVLDEAGERARFAFDEEAGAFLRDAEGELVPDPDGRPFRLWRDHVRSPDDVWDALAAAARLPGSVAAPRLQPIAARQVMLQTGMRAPMGVKILGPDLEVIEAVGLEVEALLREVEGVRPSSVFADRIVGKPYLEIDLDRPALARYGLSIRDVQEVIEVAIGGRRLTTTVEGRERYPVRVRYPRERRTELDDLGGILVPTRAGAQIPLAQLATVRYVRGPQAIRSEDTFLLSTVVFDKLPGEAEVDVVERARERLDAAVAEGALVVPPGVTMQFAGTYENQVHAQRTLRIVLPLVLLVIFVLLYLQFRSTTLALLVWSGVVVAWSGGFLLLWLYGRGDFLDVEVLGTNLRELFRIHPRNLSIAVWVGFLALFGIATDDGVVMATYLRQSFERSAPTTVAAVRAATLEAGLRRVRPCLMTTATTVLALLPVLTSSGRGSDVMVPMAIPAVGGMSIALVTMFVVPVLYCWSRERALRRTVRDARRAPRPGSGAATA